MKHLYSFLVFLSLILFTVKAEERTVTVSGYITGSGDSPLADASVTVINNSDTVYALTTNSEGYYEFEVLVDFVSGISLPALNKNYSVSMVYPNPVNSLSTPTIYYKTPDPAETPVLQIFDLGGRLMSPPYTLNTGTYFYRLIFKENISSQTRPFTVREPSTLRFNLIPEVETTATGVSSKLKNSFLAEPIDGDSVRLVIEKNEYETYTSTIILEEEAVTSDFELTKAQAPVAAIDIIGDLIVGEAVVFDATSSLAGYNENLHYEWHINGQLKSDFNKASQIFMQEGNVEVSLKVFGKYGTVSEVQNNYNISAPDPTGTFAEVLGQVYSVSGTALDSVQIRVHGRDTVYLTNRDGEIGLNRIPTGRLIPLALKKDGYATQYVKLNIPPADTQAFFEAHMIAREAAMTIENIENGGSLTGLSGVKVTLPADAMIFDDGTQASGDIDVNLTPVDVSDSSQYFAFPGSFSGLTPEGMADLILSYGTSEYHFEQDGNELALGEGQTATIEIPVFFTKSLAGEALQEGDTIPLWSLDPQTGIWVMEDYGVLVASDDSPTGLAFRGEVSHFSWWNCDIAPDPYRPTLIPQIGSSSGGSGGGGGGNGPQPGTPVPASVSGIPLGSGGAPVGTPRNALIPEGGISLPLPPNQDVRLNAFGNNGLLKGSKDVNGGAGDGGEVIIDMYAVGGAEGDNMIEPDTLFDASINPVGDVDSFVFEVDSGFTYNISVSRSGGSLLEGTVRLRDPDNLPLFSKDFSNETAFIAFSSDKNGKYYIVIDGTENEPGGYTLTLRKLNRITMNSYFEDNLLGSGDRRQYAFDGQAGQLVNLSFLSKTISGRIYLRLYDTEGNTIYNRRHQSYAETGVVRLPQTGVYMTEVYAVDASTNGDYYFGLSAVNEPQAILAEEPWVDIGDSISMLSQRRFFSFEAERGDVLNFALATQDSLTAYARVYKGGDDFFDIDQAIYGVRTTNYNASYQRAEPSRLASLPETGTYYIEVQPWGSLLTNYTGKYTVTLFNPEKRPLEADVEVRDSIKKSFHFHKYALSFPEKKGVVVRTINEDFSSYLYTSLFDTSATRNAVRSGRVSTTYGSAVFELSPVILQGDYMLEHNPSGPSHGNYTFKVITLDDPVDIASSAPYTEIGGEIDEVGERDYYRFTGDSGQIVSVDLLVPDTSYLYGSVRIYTEGDNFVSGQTLRDDYYSTAQADIAPGGKGGITLMLPYDSTYIIEVDGQNTMQENRGYGNYLLRFNAIETAATIHVDDDNADYASAVTGFVRSASRAISANGTITVHPGNYHESLEVKIIHDGVTLQGTSAENTIVGSSASNTINIEARKPVIENIQIDPARYRAILGNRNGDSTIIRNTIVRGGGDGLEFTAADYVQIYDNIIEVSTGGPAVEVTGEFTVFRNNSVNVDAAYTANNGVAMRGNHLTVEDNIIGNASTRNIGFTALRITADTALIHNNIVNNYVTGINVSPLDDDLYAYVTVSNNTLGNVIGSNGGNSDGIVINNIDSAVVINNFIKRGSDLRRGIRFSNSGGLAANNRIVVNRFQPFYYYYNQSETSTLLTIVNNTFVNTGTYAYNGGTYFSSSEATVNVELINNIITAPAATSSNFCAIDANKPLLLNDYNLINGFGADYCGSAVAGANDLYADPLLNSEDLTLTVSSPAVDAGTTSYAPSTDFEGDARNDGTIDIGADEL